MRTRQETTEIANGLYGLVMDGIEVYAREKKELVKAIMTEDLDSAYEKVSVLNRGLQAIMRGAFFNNVTFPGFLTRIGTRSEGTLKSIDLSVSSKLKAERKFKLQRDIDVDENLVKNMAQVYVDVLFNAFYTEEASKNIEELNTRLEEIYEQYEIAKRVLFVVGVDAGRVAYIDNDVVLLNADVDKALGISELGIMATGSEYAQLINEEAVKAFVDVMQTIAITPEILKKRINVVDQLVEIRTKKHANKIIRETYHKQAKYLKSAGDGVGYVSDNFDDINVFALVKMTDAGDYEYVLNPFDTEKLVAVDVDVIGTLK